MGAFFEWTTSAIPEKAMAQSELDAEVAAPLSLIEPDPTETTPQDIRGYHRRTKHAPTRYALGPAFLDWTSQPCPFRRFEGARRIDLPLLDAEPTPTFPGPAPTPASLDCAALGLFFELAFGLSAWKSFEGSTWALRNNPSSGNLHPTEAYAVINGLDGLGATAGLYHYAPEAHALEERARYAATEILPPAGAHLDPLARELEIWRARLSLLSARRRTRHRRRGAGRRCAWLAREASRHAVG
jgi:hypothetical protein